MPLSPLNLSEPPIQIWAYEGHSEFSALFLRTWARLPENARIALRKLWATPPPELLEKSRERPSPWIEFKNTLSKQNETTTAFCECFGHKFEFHAAAMRFHPSNLQEILVAHELAHASIYATASELMKCYESAGAPELPKIHCWYDLLSYSCIRHPRCATRCLNPYSEYDGKAGICETHLNVWLEHRAREINREWGFDERELSSFEQAREAEIRKILATSIDL